MTVQPDFTSTIAAATAADTAQREAIHRKCTDLIRQGICPSCQQLATGDVFPGDMARTYYQDDQLVCLLELYPRGVGHTIILSKEHYADIADMPVELGCHIVHVTHALVNALKKVVGADKVYLVTMCSGELSHLHFQLIPRRKG